MWAIPRKVSAQDETIVRVTQLSFLIAGQGHAGMIHHAFRATFANSRSGTQSKPSVRAPSVLRLGGPMAQQLDLIGMANPRKVSAQAETIVGVTQLSFLVAGQAHAGMIHHTFNCSYLL